MLAVSAKFIFGFCFHLNTLNYKSFQILFKKWIKCQTSRHDSEILLLNSFHHNNLLFPLFLVFPIKCLHISNFELHCNRLSSLVRLKRLQNKGCDRAENDFFSFFFFFGFFVSYFSLSFACIEQFVLFISCFFSLLFILKKFTVTIKHKHFHC